MKTIWKILRTFILRRNNPYVGFMMWMVFVTMSRGATLEWDYNPETNVIGYRVWVGTNSGKYIATNNVGRTNQWLLSRLTLPLGRTNYFAVTAYNSFCENDLSAEVFTNWVTTQTSLPVTSVTLRVPSGKFYVERANTTSVWLSQSIVTGPTNILFPITGTMGFYRYRPYFVSVATHKSGKLAPMKAVVFKTKPISVATPSPIGPVNLDPSKR